MLAIAQVLQIMGEKAKAHLPELYPGYQKDALLHIKSILDAQASQPADSRRQTEVLAQIDHLAAKVTGGRSAP